MPFVKMEHVFVIMVTKEMDITALVGIKVKWLTSTPVGFRSHLFWEGKTANFVMNFKLPNYTRTLLAIFTSCYEAASENLFPALAHFLFLRRVLLQPIKAPVELMSVAEIPFFTFVSSRYWENEDILKDEEAFFDNLSVDFLRVSFPFCEEPFTFGHLPKVF